MTNYKNNQLNMGPFKMSPHSTICHTLSILHYTKEVKITS